jgi:hypothetical protein
MDFFKKKISHKYFLSILIPVKNENDYLEDYIKYYLYHGVEHFYIYDNESDVFAKEALTKYLDICTVVRFPGKGVQMEIFQHFLDNYKDETKWVAVIDIDEFIFPKKHDKIKDFLIEFDNYDAIAINWLMFGDGHNAKKIRGPLIKNYLYSQKQQHPNFKTIYKTSAVAALPHPHLGKLKWFKKYVDPKKNKIRSVSNTNPTQDIIQINHYFSRSEEEYLKKINSVRVDTGIAYVEHKEDHSWIYDEHKRDNEVYNDEIWKKYGHIFE